MVKCVCFVTRRDEYIKVEDLTKLSLVFRPYVFVFVRVKQYLINLHKKTVGKCTSKKKEKQPTVRTTIINGESETAIPDSNIEKNIESAVISF